MEQVNFLQTEIEEVIIHGIGNRAKEGEIFISTDPITLDESQKSALLSYYLDPFKTNDFYKFAGIEFMGEEETFSGNYMYNTVSNMYKDPDLFIPNSVLIAQKLFDLTTHPKIEPGQLHIVRFSNCIIDEEIMDAIGIFKSESQEPFIKINKGVTAIDIERLQGFNLKKLDRGCIIFNTNKKSGYKILNVDKTKGESLNHWVNDFLQIHTRHDSYYNTELFIRLVSDFAEEILTEENNINKSDKISFLKSSENMLSSFTDFTIEDFNEEVIGNSEIIEAFTKHKEEFKVEYDIELDDKFIISKDAVKANKKMFKSVIILDKNFEILIKDNPDNLEKGFDKARSMNFYKVYFKEEI